jgi:hypothetical protein
MVLIIFYTPQKNKPLRGKSVETCSLGYSSNKVGRINTSIAAKELKSAGLHVSCTAFIYAYFLRLEHLTYTFF